MPIGDFSQQASWYKTARPTYPDELIDALIADAGVKPGDAVADFGAGTGILTRMLIARQLAVTAIEPNESMRNHNDAPSAGWIDGTFEESHLADGSQRWAVAAQAFHWADPKRALPEIRRILQPNCQFTVLWNNRANEDTEVLRWVEATIRRIVPEFDEFYRNKEWEKTIGSTGDFEFLKTRIVKHTIMMDRERFLNLWKSHNLLNNLAGPERFAQFQQELIAYLDQHNLQQIDVPYVCQAWSARRKD